MNWLDEHLETFVKPFLKGIPTLSDKSIKEYYYSLWHRSKPEYHYFSLLLEVWELTKKAAKGRTILLPGRDVFLLEVLARLQGYPTVFRPEISKKVATSKLLKDDFSEYFCIDTGFSGTVPKALKVYDWKLISYSPSYSESVSEREKLIAQRQLGGIKCTNRYVGLAGVMEGCPKYWMPGDIDGVFGVNGYKKSAKIYQSLNTKLMFSKASKITMNIAYQAMDAYKIPCPVKHYLTTSIGRLL